MDVLKNPSYESPDKLAWIPIANLDIEEQNALVGGHLGILEKELLRIGKVLNSEPDLDCLDDILDHTEKVEIEAKKHNLRNVPETLKERIKLLLEEAKSVQKAIREKITKPLLVEIDSLSSALAGVKNNFLLLEKDREKIAELENHLKKLKEDLPRSFTTEDFQIIRSSLFNIQLDVKELRKVTPEKIVKSITSQANKFVGDLKTFVSNKINWLG